MSLSDIARSIVKDQLDTGKGGTSTRNSVIYEVTTGLLDPTKDGEIASVSFVFTKPVSEDLLATASAAILNRVVNSLDLNTDTQVVNALFAKILGAKQAANIGKKRTKGTVSVNFGDPEDAEGSAGQIRGISGRYISQSNFKSALELLAKAYLIKDMQAIGAPLKFRTGRFANSLKIKDALLRDQKSNEAPELDVTYNYMTRPYSVFDPRISTYRNLSLRPFRGARNPQRLIGEAIAKALRDLIHSRYRLVVKQGT